MRKVLVFAVLAFFLAVSMVSTIHAAKYPNVQIPKEIIVTEAEEQYEELAEGQNMILQRFEGIGEARNDDNEGITNASLAPTETAE
jgi:hypothetical protein